MTGVLASLETSMDIRVKHFDHCNVDLSFLKAEEQIFMFTCHSIEQVEEIPEIYFSELAKTPKKITCVHFEPFGFQMSADNTLSARQKSIFVERKWNTNFFAVLKNASDSGAINLTHVYKDIIPNETFSPTSVAIWKNF